VIGAFSRKRRGDRPRDSCGVSRYRWHADLGASERFEGASP
jgi:hypothetical protein